MNATPSLEQRGSGLSPRREHFARELAAGKSQAAAYRTAYGAAGMCRATVHQAASRLAADGKVLARVRQLQDAAAQQSVMAGQQLLDQLAAIVFSDVGRLVDANGRVLLPHELDNQTRAAIASFKIDEYGRIEYRFWDKNSAIDKAMRYLGLYSNERDCNDDALGNLLTCLSGNVYCPVPIGSQDLAIGD